MNLGDHIQQARKKAQLSQEKLGDMVGVTRQTISNWELNITTPDANQLLALSKALQISMDAVSYTHLDQIQMDFTKSKLHVTGIYTPDYIASNSSTTDEILIYDTTEKTDGTLFIQLKDTSKNKLQEIAKQFPYAITPVSSNHTPLAVSYTHLINHRCFL